MEQSWLKATVEPHEEGGFCLHVDMLYMPEGDVLRRVRGPLVAEDGPWRTEEEAKAALDELRRWWGSL